MAMASPVRSVLVIPGPHTRNQVPSDEVSENPLSFWEEDWAHLGTSCIELNA